MSYMAKIAKRPSCQLYKLTMNGSGVGGTWTPSLNSEALNHASYSSISGDYITLDPGEYQYEYSVYATSQNSTAVCTIAMQVNDVTKTTNRCDLYHSSGSGNNFVTVGYGSLSLQSQSTVKLYTASLSAGALISPNANKSYLLLWRMQ